MKPGSVRSPVTIPVWLSPVSVGQQFKEGFADLRFGATPGEYFLTQEKNLFTVELRSPRQGQELDSFLGSGRARLATVDQVSKDGTAALVSVRFFNGEVVEIGAVDVGIDDRLHEAARRLLRTGRAGIEEIGGLLEGLCVLRPGPSDDDCYFLLTAGAAASREFEATDNSMVSDGGDVRESAVPAVERAFCIHGDGLRIAVARKQVAEDEETYLATHLTNSLGGDPDGAVRLARGRLTFSDFTRVGRIQALAAGAMSRLVEGENSYLKKWDEYGAIEGEMLLARARKVGVLRWTSVEQLSRGTAGVKFFFAEPLPEGVTPGDELEIAEHVPTYIQRGEMTWAQYSALLESEFEAKRESVTTPARYRPSEPADDGIVAGTGAKVLDVRDNSLVLDLDIPPDRTDIFLILSLSGERAQIERRMEARRLVLEGRSANPMLGLIIEENGVPPEPVRPSKIKPMSAFVRQKIFSHSPTPKQEEAIRIALNTPDIALIQGPPGTGKTTVIAAIVERLNELKDKGQSIQGEVLISAFQHDAIENMMARLTVNSTPVPKFGRRSGTSQIGDRNVELIRRWCGGIASRLREANPGLRGSEKLRDAQIRCHEYVLAPSLENAIGTLEAFLQLPDGQLSQRLAGRAIEIKQRLEDERGGRSAQADGDLIRCLWSLRTSAEGFEDDGPAMAQVLLTSIAAEIPKADRETLTQAAAWRSADPPPFLADLRHVKARLLEWYQPRAVFRLDKPRIDVLEFVSDVARHLEARSGTNRSDAILVEFLHELESNPSAAQRAVEDYGFVFAATCQQSQGKAITRRKTKAPGMHGSAMDYDTVIIDEAARSSPRDLLIPMSQGRKRIILVGDHRQLPHMIDEEIARTLEEQGSRSDERAAATEASHIRHSMFQYLLTRLKQLHARDGMTRWVTLDQQFRMHQILGDFVSDSFYCVHDPAEAFGSPLPAESFVHGLPGIEEVPAIWIDVPARAGKEEYVGTSRRRAAEAREIAKWLERWIDSPTGRRLTFGVISFYKAQGTDVFQALAVPGYTSRGPDDKWRIAEEYELRPSEENLPPEERLRIGTVDSFQGMEFDVVFLSMVRSQARVPDPSTDPAERAEQERKFYGHLTSPNRLCVSMSRQKRLLVVVGDKAMVEHELAREAVPGLVAFLNLCKTRGAVLAAGG